jgi:hypothetical protein
VQGRQSLICDKIFEFLAVNVVLVLRAAAEVECSLVDVARGSAVVQEPTEGRKASSYTPTIQAWVSQFSAPTSFS